MFTRIGLIFFLEVYLVDEFNGNPFEESTAVTFSVDLGPKYPPIRTMSPLGDCQAEWAALGVLKGLE